MIQWHWLVVMILTALSIGSDHMVCATIDVSVSVFCPNGKLSAYNLVCGKDLLQWPYGGRDSVVVFLCGNML